MSGPPTPPPRPIDDAVSALDEYTRSHIRFWTVEVASLNGAIVLTGWTLNKEFRNQVLNAARAYPFPTVNNISVAFLLFAVYHLIVDSAAVALAAAIFHIAHQDQLLWKIADAGGSIIVLLGIAVHLLYEMARNIKHD